MKLLLGTFGILLEFGINFFLVIERLPETERAKLSVRKQVGDFGYSG